MHRGLGARRFDFLLCRVVLFFLRHFYQIVAGGRNIGVVEVVVTQALDGVVRGRQMHIGDQHNVDLEAGLDAVDIRAFLV